jgi:hypothetical protein
MFVEGMLCNDNNLVFMPYHKYDSLNKSLDFMPKIKKYYQTEWFTNQSAIWNNRFRPEFTEILTKFGYGFAFNMLPKSELFTDKFVVAPNLKFY